MRISLGLLALALLLSASCRSQSPTTSPATESLPNSVERLSALYPSLKEQWLIYRNTEGEAHRSDRFANVADSLDLTCFGDTSLYNFGTLHLRGSVRGGSTTHATRIEVLSFLGLPDCGETSGQDAVYVYYYWRSDTHNRWEADVEIHNGLLKQIGWNDASVNDNSTLKQYRKWSDVLGPVK
jgi:hypothetical protein